MKRAAGFLADHRQGDQPTTEADVSIPVYERIGTEMGRLLEKKNQAYGPALSTGPNMLALLFPTGIHPSRYQDVPYLTRIWEKMSRIATRPDAFGESPYKDIAGYAIHGAAKDSTFEKKDEGDLCPSVGEKV